LSKPRLLIITTEYHHPLRFRLHSFIPYFNKAFSVRVVDVASPFFDWNSEESPVNFMITKVLAQLPRSLWDFKTIDDIELLTLRSLMSGAISKLFSYPLVRHVVHKIQSSDIVLATPYTACMMALFSKTETPIVYEDVDRFYLFYKNPLKRFLVRYLEEYCISHAAYVITASPELQDDCIELRGENVSFIPNGVDFSFFRNAIERCPEDRRNRYVLIYVGTVEPWSGIDIALKALAEAICEEPRLKLVIVGEGSVGYVNYLKRLAKKLGILSNVSFLGKKPYTEIPTLLLRAGIGIATFPTSEIMKKAFPYKILEYGAAGLPILMTNVTYLAKLVKENEAGVVVEKLNASDIAAGILGLIHNRAKWHQMALNAMTLMRRYDVKRLATEEIKILLELIR